MEWVSSSASLEPVVRVGAGALLAGLIGFEREAKGKPAGFRTHMLTGGAAALLVALGPLLVKEFSRAGVGAEITRTDPLRIIEAVILGVSFIGAGTILKVAEEQRVRYLTTAASVLLSAGVGIAVAVGEVVLAVAVVLLVLLVNYVFMYIDRRLEKSPGS